LLKNAEAVHNQLTESVYARNLCLTNK